jgi:hypothetical protein
MVEESAYEISVFSHLIQIKRFKVLDLSRMPARRGLSGSWFEFCHAKQSPNSDITPSPLEVFSTIHR